MASFEEWKGISLDGIMDRSCSLEKNFLGKVLVLFLASFFQRGHSVYSVIYPHTFDCQQLSVINQSNLNIS